MSRHRSRLYPSAARTLGIGAAVAVLSSMIAPPRAAAGGFYLLERGTRSLGRGGAFVAGVDDPSALWMNPAGLGLSGDQLLLDATMTFVQIDYTRIDSGGVTQPTVHGSNIPLPIPMIAGTTDFDLEHFTFGLGIFAPNAALLEYPESISVDGQPYPAPQRYSLYTMNGSIVAMIAAGAAWTPLPDELSIGLGVHVITGAFAARVALSACEGSICTFREDPDYDGVAQITLSPLITASGVLGVTWNPGPVRIGGSISTPFSLSGTADMQVRMPGAAAFSGAYVRNRAGDCAGVSDETVANDPGHPCRRATADVNIDFPVVVRFGVELLAVENLRLELAVVWETWSFQEDVAVRPRDVWLSDALSFLDYQVGALSIPRNMHDTVSVRLGGEYSIEDFLVLRAGMYFENGAFDDAYLSALTIDSEKLVFGLGGAVRLVDGLWADLTVGYAHLFSRSVRNSAVPQPNPIRPPQQPGVPGMPSTGDPVYVGNGDYSFITPYFGLGLRWQLDWAPRPVAPLEPEPAPAATEQAPPEQEAGAEAEGAEAAGAGESESTIEQAPPPVEQPEPARQPRRRRGRGR